MISSMALSCSTYRFLVAAPLGLWGAKALSFAKGRVWLGRVVIISVIYLALAFVRLPFSIVRYFHAHQYDLRYDTLSTYLLDWSKGLGTGWFMVVIVGLIGLLLASELDDLQRIVANHFDQDFLSKAADYHRTRLVLFFIQTGFILTAIGFLVAAQAILKRMCFES